MSCSVIPPANSLLQALPAEDCAHLLARLEPVELPLRMVLHRPGDPIEHVYFIEEGIVSLIIILGDGQEAEVGLIGRQDGAVGLAAALGNFRATTEALVQVPGRALRLPLEALRAEMTRRPALTAELQRFLLVQYLHVMQTAACNGRHSLEERLARWLLMMHDRVGRDELPTTHEFVAKMLSVRRAGVTVAVAMLEQAGAISHARGSVTVLDRHRLEGASCECYAAVQRAIEPLLPR